ncbi:terminase small subunit [Methylobacterium fujisawaense]
MSLTPKQQRFVEEYLVDLNATQAAIRAGYSERTAGSVGHENLQKPEIAAAIEAGRAKLSEAAEVSAERVMREVALIALADPRSVMTWGPKGVTLIDSKTLTRDHAAIVAEVAQTKDGIRLKTHSKLDALEKLIRRMGLNAPEKHDVSVKVDGLDSSDVARRLAFMLASGAAAQAPTKD